MVDDFVAECRALIDADITGSAEGSFATGTESQECEQAKHQSSRASWRRSEQPLNEHFCKSLDALSSQLFARDG